MKSRTHIGSHRTAGRRRRGAVVVLVMISLVVIFGCAALAVDLTMLYSAQTELQRSADAAALAAALELSGGNADGVEDEAYEMADTLVERNDVMRKSHGLDGMNNLEFGICNRNATSGKSTFEPRSAPPYDAVRVTVRRASNSGGGSVALYFSQFFGRKEQDLEARAAATIIPRDIALSVDLSGSMTWDSSLRFWNRDDGGFANTRDVWAALNGPEPSKPYEATSEAASEYASDTGPTFGNMAAWGTKLTPGAYNPATDPGVFYIKKSSTQTSSAITTYLTSKGYSADERTIIMNKDKDSDANHFRRRTAVMLGLASWKSGRSGGKAGGNGDKVLDSSEVTYIATPTWSTGWAWTDYIDYWQNSQSDDAATFRYYYGLKTLTDFVLIKHPKHSESSTLWATPELPQRAVKDAIQAMMDELTAQDAMDHVSLEVFATTSKHEINLTNKFKTVADTMYERQAGHYDTTTNLGAALGQAITELTSSRGRANARKMIILLSDGLPNVDENGNGTSDGATAAVNYTRNKAKLAAQKGIQVHTVSVGSAADRTLMKEIANIGGGIEFYAGGTPEEYAESLQNIFRRIGGRRPVRLIE